MFLASAVFGCHRPGMTVSLHRYREGKRVIQLAHDQFLCEEVFFTQELALAVTTGDASSQHMFSPQPPASTTNAGFSPSDQNGTQRLPSNRGEKGHTDAHVIADDTARGWSESIRVRASAEAREMRLKRLT